MFFVLQPAFPTLGTDINNIQNAAVLANPINIANVDMNNNNINNNKQRTRFSKDEDDLLKSLVENQNERVDWNHISTLMAGRTPRQCRERYTNYLRPQLVNGTWTEEEEKLLEKMFEEYGPQWSRIAQHFPNRSDVNIKNHHTCIVNRLYRESKAKKAANQATTANENVINNDNSKETQNENERILEPIRPIEIIENSHEIISYNNNNNQIEMNNQQNNADTVNISQSNSLQSNTLNSITYEPIAVNQNNIETNQNNNNPVIPNQASSNSNDVNQNELIKAITDLAKSQKITIDENLIQSGQLQMPIDSNNKNEILKNMFSLLVNLSLMISRCDN